MICLMYLCDPCIRVWFVTNSLAVQEASMETKIVTYIVSATTVLVVFFYCIRHIIHEWKSLREEVRRKPEETGPEEKETSVGQTSMDDPRRVISK
jgi:hypothetical protein